MTEKAHPTLFDRVIAVDVGPGAAARPGESEALWGVMLVVYQLINLICWVIGSRVPIIGPLIANAALRSFTVVTGFGTGAWTPTPWFERSYTQSYPYWHAWRHDDPSKCLAFTQGYQPNEAPSCPTLFVASTVGMNLHGKEWIDAIEKKGASDHSSKALLLDGCHHWLMHQCSKQFNGHVSHFLQASNAVTARAEAQAATVKAHSSQRAKESSRRQRARLDGRGR